jgi:hypothetical protein
MKRTFVPAFVAVLLIGASLCSGAAPLLAQSGRLALLGVTPNATSVQRYHTVELAVDVTATYDNPFDPDQIDIVGEFSGPGGRQMHVNGFLDQEYVRTKDSSGNEVLTVEGTPIWRVRFTPDAVGTWKYTVTARDRSGTVRSKVAALTVMPSDDPGFVRVSSRNPAYFAYSNGTVYFPVGEDMCWGNGPQTYNFETWLPKLRRAGGNWIRVWMGNWNCGIEWTGSGFSGLGEYNLANAWRLDRLLDLADENGVKVQLCFGTYGEFTTGGYFNEGQWAKNPYNSANGGPCANPNDFWTDPAARKLYRQRLRYIAARYGARAGIMGWELFNEANAPAPWVDEMAQYLKGAGTFAGQTVDSYHHLVSTTYGSDAIWKLNDIDYSQTHCYGEGGTPDMTPQVIGDAVDMAVYHKPHLMAEFGIDWRHPDAFYDPDGVGANLHDGLWASVSSGDAGTAMLWWWDNYVDPKNMYPQLTPLAKIAASFPWLAEGGNSQLTFDAVTRSAGHETFVPVLLTASDGWGRAKVTDFTINAAPTQSNPKYPAFLYSAGKPDLRTTPVFSTNYAVPGDFVVHVATVSNNATLAVLVDGNVAYTHRFDAAPPTDANTKPEYVQDISGGVRL